MRGGDGLVCRVVKVVTLGGLNNRMRADHESVVVLHPRGAVLMRQRSASIAVTARAGSGRGRAAPVGRRIAISKTVLQVEISVITVATPVYKEGMPLFAYSNGRGEKRQVLIAPFLTAKVPVSPSTNRVVSAIKTAMRGRETAKVGRR